MGTTCVIPCKGRRASLEESVPRLLNQATSEGHKILIVDYGCPDNVWRWCQDYRSDDLDCVRVLDHGEEFNVSRARNCGNRLVTTDIIVALDADCHLKDRCFLSRMSEPVARNPGTVTLASAAQQDGSIYPGQTYMAYRKNDWIAIRGYDEQMTGWGYEDTDFYMRMKAHVKCRHLQATASQFVREDHDDYQRVKFYAEKDVAKSWQRNCEHATSRLGVNLQGFAVFDYEYYRGDNGSVGVGSYTYSPTEIIEIAAPKN
jgi:glycosyltransferase involved in cell wall biosynthesis